MSDTFCKQRECLRHLTGKLCVDGRLSHQAWVAVQMGLCDWLCVLRAYRLCGYLTAETEKASLLEEHINNGLPWLEKQVSAEKKGYWMLEGCVVRLDLEEHETTKSAQ